MDEQQPDKKRPAGVKGFLKAAFISPVTDMFGIKFCGLRSWINLTLLVFIMPIIVMRAVVAYLKLCHAASKGFMTKPVFMCLEILLTTVALTVTLSYCLSAAFLLGAIGFLDKNNVTLN